MEASGVPEASSARFGGRFVALVLGVATVVSVVVAPSFGVLAGGTSEPTTSDTTESTTGEVESTPITVDSTGPATIDPEPTTVAPTDPPTTTAPSTTVGPTTVAPTTPPTTVAPTVASTLPPRAPRPAEEPTERLAPVFGVRVVPGVAAPGSTISATGRGFNPGERVTGMQFSDPLSLGTKRADDRGVVTFTWVLAADTELTRHEVRLTGERSGSVSAWFQVIDELPNSGSNSAVVVIVAVVLLASGSALAVFARRRPR